MNTRYMYIYIYTRCTLSASKYLDRWSVRHVLHPVYYGSARVAYWWPYCTKFTLLTVLEVLRVRYTSCSLKRQNRPKAVCVEGDRIDTTCAASPARLCP